jgi:hypothetical protein
MIRTLALAMGATLATAQTGLNNKGVTGCTRTKQCGLCEGDCDNDHDCKTGMTCFQRNGMQPIPGCTSGGKMDRRGFDFCYFTSTGNNMGLTTHEVVNKGWSGCSNTKPCAICQGDCDNDKQCQAPLKCFQRKAMEQVPGCTMTGGNAGRKTRSVDFCYDATAGTNMGLVHHNLVVKGWSGCKTTAPCAMCEGDCDNDKECTAPLKCFQRNGLQKVPGCSNRGNTKKTRSVDFCYDATAGNNMGLVHHNLVNKGWSGCSNTKPCAMCEGDCDSDKQCTAPLKCFQRNGLQRVPGCSNRGNSKKTKSVDFCYDATAGNNMGMKHHNLVVKGWSGCKTTAPCAMCEGDCDNDKECTAPLKCFQRNGLQKVPGCSNRGNSKKTRSVDFCYDATAGNNMGLVHHNLVNKGWAGCSNTKPCAMCEGDCDSDKQCTAPLKCFQRNGNQRVPGCSNRGNTKKTKSVDFCYDATAGNNMGMKHHNLVNKGVSGCTKTKRCGLCQGDCDSDLDCAPSLKCFQRNGLQPVPGCNMVKKGNRAGYDFCFFPGHGYNPHQGGGGH